MGLKRFQPAIEDCQQALFILSSPSQPPNPAALSKTLLRLARCQYSLGLASPASASLTRLLDAEPTNAAALQLKSKVTVLEGHIKNFESSKANNDWGMARLSLEKCTQVVDAEGGVIPGEWRMWKVDLDLARGNLEAAGLAATDVLRIMKNSPDAYALRAKVLFLEGKLTVAAQHCAQALRLDPGHEQASALRKRVKVVEAAKDEGNLLFKQGKLLDAVEAYEKALEAIGKAEAEGKGGQIRATLLSNKATSLLKVCALAKVLG